MDSMPIQIQMFGEFALRNGSACVSDSGSRSKKAWLLLAYMIYHRSRTITSQEYMNLLWGEEERSANPLNALKTMFHRIRNSLDLLGNGLGHQLVIRRGATYAWNPEVSIILDIDEFERLCKAGGEARREEERIQLWQEACRFYQGDFLSKLSSELWVVPIAAYYHNLYVQTVLSLLPLLEQRGRWQDVAELCRIAIEREPYQEEFYSYRMKALLQMKNQREAAMVYEEMSDLFLAAFGVMPSDEIRTLYREALRSSNEVTVSSGMLLEQLREPAGAGGALFCEYDVFRNIYHSAARMVVRSGDAAHLALISILPQKEGELARRSLDRVVENLQELIRSSLRRGDVAARCSVSQFILLLPQANYENSCMVCDRLIRAFVRQYPHSPAKLHASVHPLEPNQ